MQVREIMVRPVVVVREDASLEEVARTMLERGIGCAPVVDAYGKMCGIITESDFAARERGFPFSTFRWPQVFGQWLPREGVEHIYQAARTLKARDIMTSDVVTVTGADPIEDVVRLMLQHGIHRIPVVRDGVPEGMVTRRQLLRLLLPPESQSDTVTNPGCWHAMAPG